MKKTVLLISLFFLLFGVLSAEDKIAETEPLGPPEIVYKEVKIPEKFYEKLETSNFNWLAKKINITIHKAITTKKVVLESLTDYLFIQTTPKFAYMGEEAREMEEVSELFGTVPQPKQGAMLSVFWSDSAKAGLPYKKKLTDSLLFPAENILHNDVELTFFVEMIKLTGRVYSALKRNESLVFKYNSKNRFYRVESSDKKMKSYIFVQVPNIAYEIVYTGEPVENILKRYIEELDTIFTVMKKYEPLIKNKKELTFDGRNIKGKDIFVDLWFLYQYVKEKNVSAESVIKKALEGSPVKVVGFEEKKR